MCSFWDLLWNFKEVYKNMNEKKTVPIIGEVAIKKYSIHDAKYVIFSTIQLSFYQALDKNS